MLKKNKINIFIFLALNFLKKLLDQDPNSRITAEQALEDEYIQGDNYSERDLEIPEEKLATDMMV